MKNFFFRLACIGGCLGAFIYLVNYQPFGSAGADLFVQEASPPHTKLLGVFVINLKDSQQRYAYVFPSLEALGYDVHRVEAVDGRALGEEELKRMVDFEANRSYLGGKLLGRGAVGCALSHRKAWSQFLASDYQYALICEDDIGFSSDIFQTVLKEVLEVGSLWDVCAFALGRKGAPLTLKILPSGHRMCLYLRTVFSASCYVINRYAARQLIEKSLPIKVPVDHYYNSGWALNLSFVGIEPRLVSPSYGKNNSDIDRISREHILEKSSFPMHWLTKNWFSFRTGIARFVNGLFLYFQYKVIGSALGHAR
jgi:glycosyl transferase family 25